MRQRLLLMCGVIAPLLFVFMAILGGALRPGYSHLSDTVSELMSPGSPNKLLLDTLYAIYALLLALFGVGLLQFVGASERPTPIGTIGAALLIAAGLVNAAVAVLFPQDAWGTPPTFAGEMHQILHGIIGLLTMLSMSFIGLWFHRTRILPRYGIYSWITAGAAALAAAVFVATQSSPIMGLTERIAGLVGFQWTLVLSLRLLREVDQRVGRVGRPADSSIA